MEINYLGHSCFKIKTNSTVIVIDPYPSNDPKLGLTFPKTEANILTISHSHSDHNNISAVSGNSFIITGPGEYEVGGVHVFGYKTFHDDKQGELRGTNIIYLFEAEGMSILHLGDLGHELDNSLIEDLGEVDILMVPVGGIFTLDAVKATEVVRRIEPKMVIPMHYKQGETGSELAPVEPFFKAMGAENPERIDKLKISKDKLPEETKLVVMEIAR